MNTSKTEHGPYEYDRTKLKEHIDSCWGEQRIDSNAELNDFLHRQQGQPYDRNSDLIGMVYVSREWLEENCQECRDREEWMKADRKTSRQALVLLVLVFAGVVLWKVWIG